ncbi:recombinase family protein [Aquabacterium sp. J223]|uniref:recombinase family protein n=1 Tax=Aquabacterium sp. J223 TaxID=2898431 RepID=UPI0021AD9EFE|nr:recombinase family protein [Aquabacterium sp. J223]UUX94562.1 recombinase family protein [Aquabacterium sp. J223]
MGHPCIYGRYSLDIQKPTSIDDQVSRCRSLAAREGLTVADDWVFSDEAVTGRAEGLTKRMGYQRMLDAWEAGLLDIVFADEVSRFSRDMLDGAKLMRMAERTGVVIVTGDGIDTRREGWQTLWTMRLAMAAEELRSVAKRTSRTMQGCLDRGLMIGPPPYGYALDIRRKDKDEQNLKGARWVVNEAQAEVIRTMFGWRKSGLSVAAIARRLNDQGIACPRTSGAKRPGYWRPATVHRMLQNPIYRGTFVYLGSGATRAKLARQRKMPETKAYDRPQFRLVDDALWQACNPPRQQRTRGGTKHLFANFVQCGDCGCYLSLKGTSASWTLHCPQCEQAVRVGERESFIGYTSVVAAQKTLEQALTLLFTGPVRDEFSARLRARLEKGPGEEEERLRARRLELESSCERLLQLARRPGIGLEFLAQQLEEDKTELDRVTARLAALTRAAGKVSKAAIERQLAVEPTTVVSQLLNGAAPAHEVRATLKRLIESFRFVDRPRKFEAMFEIRFVPGAFVAELSDSDVLDSTAVTMRIHTKTGARRPPPWEVTVTQVT